MGAGAVGLPLAAILASEGRSVVAVRTREGSDCARQISVTVHSGAEEPLEVRIETVSLSELPKLDGMVVLTVKAHANQALASELLKKPVTGPLVIMQNGIGVEKPFLALPFSNIYRCVLYLTSQPTLSPRHFTFRSIASSPIGVVRGRGQNLDQCVAALTTPRFPFHSEEDIQREIWKKAIINAVFNSVCPLLDVDNGIFARDDEAAKLAIDIIGECILLANRKNICLTESAVIEQLMKISRGSQGVLISTLQDIRNGRETEMEYLNLEMARMASSLRPKIALSRTELLGRMIRAKSREHGARHA